MVDQDHPPVLGDQHVALAAVLVGDQVVEETLQVSRPVPAEDLVGRRLDLLLDFVPERHGVVDPVLAGAEIVMKPALDGRRNHVEAQQSIQAIGRDFILPALDIPLLPAPGVFP